MVWQLYHGFRTLQLGEPPWQQLLRALSLSPRQNSPRPQPLLLNVQPGYFLAISAYKCCPQHSVALQHWKQPSV